MELVLHSVTHHNCPVEHREKVALGDEERRALLARMRAERAIGEAAILQTCNRTEIYLYVRKGCDSGAVLSGMLTHVKPEAVDHWSSYAVRSEGADVVRHLFEVAAGLDSQMLGENQILAQVKSAYTESLEAGASRFVFHRLFHIAFRAGKAVRAQTSINCGAVSVALAAVELARDKANPGGSTAIVIGAGDNAELAARYLMKAGFAHLIIANRSVEKAQSLCCRIRGGRPIGLAEIPEHLSKADVVIASTGADEPVVTKREVKPVLARRRKPLLIIDVAVPRDVEPSVADLGCVKLVNIDGLNSRISANKKRRSREIPKARRIIDELTRQFVAWNESLDIVPIIARLSRKGEELARMEARRYAKHFPGGGAEKLEVFARSLVKKILHGPISAVKSDNGEEPTAEQLQAAELIGRMFFAPPSKRQ